MGFPTIPGVETDEKRVDYDADGNPVYIGTAKQGTLASGLGWNIYKYTWNGDGDWTHRQHRVGIWDNRATLGWV